MALADESAKPSLSLSMHVDSNVALGEAVNVTIIFANAGNSPFFLYRGVDIGAPGELELSGETQGCKVAVPQTHIEVPAAWEPFLFVPLIPSREIKEVVRLNDVHEAFIEFPIHTPGTYLLTSRLIAAKRKERYSPLWEGRAESAPTKLVVLPPRPESLSRWTAVLTKCVSGDCRDLEAASKYFTIVRDPSAADLLARVISRVPSVARALAAQGRKADAPLIRQHGTSPSIPGARDFYLKAADKLERGGDCN
jgi:hypothetical protein